MWRPSVRNSIFSLSVRLFVCLFLYCLIYYRTYICTLNSFMGVNQYFRVVKIFKIVRVPNQLVVVYWLPSIKSSNPFLAVAIIPSSSILVLLVFKQFVGIKLIAFFPFFSLQILLHQYLQYKTKSRHWRVLLCESWLISLLSFFYVRQIRPNRRPAKIKCTAQNRYKKEKHPNQRVSERKRQ